MRIIGKFLFAAALCLTVTLAYSGTGGGNGAPQTGSSAGGAGALSVCVYTNGALDVVALGVGRGRNASEAESDALMNLAQFSAAEAAGLRYTYDDSRVQTQPEHAASTHVDMGADVLRKSIPGNGLAVYLMANRIGIDMSRLAGKEYVFAQVQTVLTSPSSVFSAMRTMVTDAVKIAVTGRYGTAPGVGAKGWLYLTGVRYEEASGGSPARLLATFAVFFE